MHELSQAFRQHAQPISTSLRSLGFLGGLGFRFRGSGFRAKGSGLGFRAHVSELCVDCSRFLDD